MPSKLQSLLRLTTTKNISRAKVTVTDTPGANNLNEYYLSNDNAATFEGPVTSGVTHTFTSTGTQFTWRAFLIKRSKNADTVSNLAFDVEEELATWT